MQGSVISQTKEYAVTWLTAYDLARESTYQDPEVIEELVLTKAQDYVGKMPFDNGWSYENIVTTHTPSLGLIVGIVCSRTVRRKDGKEVALMDNISDLHIELTDEERRQIQEFMDKNSESSVWSKIEDERKSNRNKEPYTLTDAEALSLAAGPAEEAVTESIRQVLENLSTKIEPIAVGLIGPDGKPLE